MFSMLLALSSTSGYIYNSKRPLPIKITYIITSYVNSLTLQVASVKFFISEPRQYPRLIAKPAS